MIIGDKVRVREGYFKDKIGFIDEVLELEVFENVFMVDLGDVSVSFTEKHLELIK